MTQPALCGGRDAGYEEDALHYDQGGWQVNRPCLDFATIFWTDPVVKFAFLHAAKLTGLVEVN